MGILSKIKGWLPVTKRELNEIMDMLMDICDAIETADKQHSNIERSLIQQMSEQPQESNQDVNEHMEFG